MGEGGWAGLLGGGDREAAAPRGGVEEVLIIELTCCSPAVEFLRRMY